MTRRHPFPFSLSVPGALPVLAALAVAAVAAPPAAAQVTTPKELVYPPLPAFQVPKPVRFVLPNGMVVMVMEDHELPLVNVTARIRTGSLLEPADKVGLAGLFGTTQRSGGTTTRKPDALDEFLESRAAAIETGMGADSASASMSALKADVPAVLEAFADVLRNPAFDADRVKVAVTAINASIARQNDNPQGITGREFTKAIQGADTPFGRTTTYASIASVTRDDLLAWHKKYYHPNRVILGVVGDITVAEARTLVTKAFGDWPKGPAVTDTWPVPRTAPNAGVFEAAKADSTQSFVAVGHQGELLRTSPDYFPVTVMNEVLAGGFTSRLFGKIRTELGLAYSVGGSVNTGWTRVAPFQMQMSTRADATVKAIEALIAEAKQLASTRPATDAELARAKQSILNSFIFNNDEPDEVLGQQLAFEYYGQPLDWLDRYRAGVEKVTTADVARVAAKYIHPERFSIVVVGPTEGRDKPLSTLGTVKAIDLTIPPPPSAPAGAGATGGASAPAGKPGAANAPAGSGGATAEAKAKGQALIAKAVEGMGGAAAVDGVTTYSATGKADVKTPQGDMTIETRETLALPDRFRQDLTLPFGQISMIVAGSDAFVISPQGEQAMPSSIRERIDEQMVRVPLLLLRQRTQPGFEAVAAGEGKAGDVTTSLVTVTLKGNVTTLGLDPTGRIVTVAFRGAGPDGVPGDMLHTYSDFRPAGSLTLPYKQQTTLNGEVNGTATTATVAINQPVDEALWKRKGATP
jgi:predicted Zn-dependent peptidase